MTEDHRHPDWGDYTGEGIWRVCPSCNAPHEVTDPAFQNEIQDACYQVSASSQKAYEEFGFSKPGRWGVDAKNGIFTNTLDAGPRAVAPYGIIGSWNSENHSWLWSWAMSDSWMPAKAKEVAQRFYDVGEEYDWEAVTSKNLLVNEKEAWHLTHLAAYVSGYPIVYRAKVNEINHHYYAIGAMTWEN